MSRFKEKLKYFDFGFQNAPFTPTLDKKRIFLKKWAPSLLCLLKPNFMLKIRKKIWANSEKTVTDRWTEMEEWTNSQRNL